MQGIPASPLIVLLVQWSTKLEVAAKALGDWS